MQEIIDKWFSGCRCFQNYAHAVNGKIWMLWCDDFQVSLIYTTDQSVTASVKLDDHSFYFSAIYGCNDGVDKRRLWNHLFSIQVVSRTFVIFHIAQLYTNASLRLLLIDLSNTCQNLLATIKVHLW